MPPMRRPARLPFVIRQAASLALCVTTIGLWVRSGRGDAFGKVAPWGAEVISAGGRLRVCLYRGLPGSTPFRWQRGGQPLRRRAVGETSSVRPYGPVEAIVGVGQYHATERWGDESRAGASHADGWVSATWHEWAAPHWLLTLLFALPLLRPPLSWLARRRQQVRRARTGLCRDCGYDMRASPGRCPECGALARPGSPDA